MEQRTMNRKSLAIQNSFGNLSARNIKRIQLKLKTALRQLLCKYLYALCYYHGWSYNRYVKTRWTD